MKDGGITPQELEGLFESLWDNDTKITDLKSQIKAINIDSGECLKAFSESSEIEMKSLKSAYKYWCETKEGGKSDEDFFVLVSIIDTMLEEENA